MRFMCFATLVASFFVSAISVGSASYAVTIPSQASVTVRSPIVLDKIEDISFGKAVAPKAYNNLIILYDPDLGVNSEPYKNPAILSDGAVISGSGAHFGQFSVEGDAGTTVSLNITTTNPPAPFPRFWAPRVKYGTNPAVMLLSFTTGVYTGSMVLEAGVKDIVLGGNMTLFKATTPNNYVIPFNFTIEYQ